MYVANGGLAAATPNLRRRRGYRGGPPDGLTRQNREDLRRPVREVASYGIRAILADGRDAHVPNPLAVCYLSTPSAHREESVGNGWPTPVSNHHGPAVSCAATHPRRLPPILARAKGHPSHAHEPVAGQPGLSHSVEARAHDGAGLGLGLGDHDSVWSPDARTARGPRVATPS